MILEKSAKSRELFDIMMNRGYPEEFCTIVTDNLNTDFTAQRMIGYLSHYESLPLSEVADEMISILTDRDRIIQKKIVEHNNEVWNRYLTYGFGEDE